MAKGPLAPEAERLSEQLQEFVRLSREIDEAVRSGDEERVKDAQAALQEFYGTRTAAEQEEIRVYVQQQIVGRTIEDDRGAVHSGFARVMHWPRRLVGATVEPVAKLSEETIRLVVLTVGLSVRGVVRGVRDIFRKAA